MPRIVLCRIHADALSRAPESLKGHLAVNERKERIVPSPTYVLARMDLRASLSDEDISGAHPLAAEFLYAQPLSLTISAIS